MWMVPILRRSVVPILPLFDRSYACSLLKPREPPMSWDSKVQDSAAQDYTEPALSFLDHVDLLSGPIIIALLLGTTTGGSREIFRHRDNALTYTAGNPEELGERILELANSPSLRARIATIGQTEVRASYALPIIVDQIERYLAETLSKWQPPGLPDFSE